MDTNASKYQYKAKKAVFDRSQKSTSKKVPPKRVACVCRSFNNKLLVSADDKRRLALYRFPSLPNALPKLYAGHGFPATSVAWTFNDEYVVSVGGNDCTIFSVETCEGETYTNQKGATSPKAFASKREQMYSIEEAWEKLEDVKTNEAEPELNKNIDIKWNYLEDDTQIQPPAVLGLPDLQSERPQFKPLKPRINRANKPKPAPPPRRKRSKGSASDVAKESNNDQSEVDARNANVRSQNDEVEAAKKIQAIQRGKADRQKVKELREQTEAAKKIQAIQRGKAERQKVKELKEQTEAAKKNSGNSTWEG